MSGDCENPFFLGLDVYVVIFAVRVPWVVLVDDKKQQLACESQRTTDWLEL